MKLATPIQGHSVPRATSAIALARCAVAVTLVWLAGCKSTEQAMNEGADTTRTLIGSVDPTGAIAETEERKKLWTAARKRFEELDIARFNQTVEALGAAVQRLDERVAAFDVQSIREASASTHELMKTVRGQIEQARAAEISDKALGLLTNADLRVQALNPDQIAAIVAGLAESTARLHDVIDALDGRLAAVADGAQTLAETATRRVAELPSDDIRSAALQVRSAADEIGVAAGHIRRATAPLPAASTELENTLRWARTMLITATGVLTVAGISLLAWLIRGRPKSSPSA